MKYQTVTVVEFTDPTNYTRIFGHEQGLRGALDDLDELLTVAEHRDVKRLLAFSVSSMEDVTEMLNTGEKP